MERWLGFVLICLFDNLLLYIKTVLMKKYYL